MNPIDGTRLKERPHDGVLLERADVRRALRPLRRMCCAVRRRRRSTRSGGTAAGIGAGMQTLTPSAAKSLNLRANDVRARHHSLAARRGFRSLAGSLDMADIFTALYGHIMRHDPAARLVASAIACCYRAGTSRRYATRRWQNFGYLPVEELLTLRKFGSRLQGHPERVKLPALETTSGPLGEGLAQGTGMALGPSSTRKTGAFTSSLPTAEHQCGLHWEAMMTAAKFKLDNLTCIVDRNFIQIDGSTEDVMPLEPFADKYRAFNWEVFECDGNDIRCVHRGRRARKSD